MMAKGIYSGVDCANKGGCGCLSELCMTSHSSFSLPLLLPEAMPMGDIFYGSEDHEEINDYMYKEGAMECMRRERDSKALKMRQKRYGNFFECLDFLGLLVGRIKL